VWFASEKHSSETIEESVASQQNFAIENVLQKKHGAVMVSGSALLPSPASNYFSKLAAASTCTTLTSIRGRKPPPFVFLYQGSIE
jgi:hypothetical protein